MSAAFDNPVGMTEEAVPRRAPQLGGAARICLAIILAYVLISIVSPFLVGDYMTINTGARLRPPGAEHWFGTDHLGRDIFARTLVGTRNSLVVGFAIAVTTITIGTLIGLYAGYFRFGDRVVMRIMDGLMAIPGVLLAVALVSVLGSGLITVIIAITIPDIPRAVRLVRSVTLALKEQPFIAASISIGTSTPKILFRHILPNAAGALSVKATYICAAAIITESILSFLGVGTPPEIPSWGNIIAVGRQYFQIAPWIIAFPGIFLSILILTVNVLGDALRDGLDPRLVERSGLK